MRINQWISHNTKYSRREADSLIKDGRVRIGDKIATLSDKVFKTRVYIDKKAIKPLDQSKYTVIVYNKPKGELVAKKDNRDRKVIYDSLDTKFSHFIPVGRLDYASEGLLILSDNPSIVTSLMESNLIRIYNLKIDSKITNQIIDAMQDGLSLDNARAGGHKLSKIKSMDFLPFEFCEIIKESKCFTKIKVGIKEGKNRELRRFFAHFKINVLDLKRVSYGFVELNALPTGKSRYLTRKEYNKLHNFIRDNKRKNKTPRESNVS